MAYKIVTLKKAGKKPIKFKQGALRGQLGIKKGKKIPASTMKAALAGKKGKLAKKRAQFKKNVLTGRKGNK